MGVLPLRLRLRRSPNTARQFPIDGHDVVVEIDLALKQYGPEAANGPHRLAARRSDLTDRHLNSEPTALVTVAMARANQTGSDYRPNIAL